MKKLFIAALFAALSTTTVVAQDMDEDVDFGFDDPNNPTIITTFGTDVGTTFEGFGIAEGEFENTFGEIEAEDPGFFSDQTETGDEVFVRLLNAGPTGGNSGVGAGFLSFFNPTTGAIEAGGVLEVREPNLNPGNEGTFTGETFTGTDAISLGTGAVGDGSEDFEGQILNEGEIHTHLIFDIPDDSPDGVYGLLLQLDADLADDSGNTDGVIDVSSNPFFLLLRTEGLSDEVFAQSLTAFGAVAVPEPSTGVLVAAVAGAIFTRRRRRR